VNIFILDYDQQKCAEYMCDKHIVKMLLESVQLLCVAYYYTSQPELSPYRLTHNNHPCSVWVKQSLSNWIWLMELSESIYEEYQFRYNNKIHKSGELLNFLPVPNLIDIGITEFAQAMPEQYKQSNTIQVYRNYYKHEKKHLFRYTKRNIPDFLLS
jgi:hypothetical protein